MAALIEVDDLTKIYPNAIGAPPALDGVALSIERGEFVAVMGPSGSGKSTFMNLVGCLDGQTRGIYYLDGVDVASLDHNALAELRNRTLGFVFQGFNLLPRLTALENVMLPMVYAGVGRNERRERALAMLAATGLGGLGDRRPNQLSGGQQQRVATRVVVIGQTVADQLFGNSGEDPSWESVLGKQIRMKGVPFEVVGILEKKGKAFGGNDQDDLVLAPLATVPRTLGTSMPAGAVSYVMVQVAKGSPSTDVAFELANLMRERHRIAPGAADDFTIGDMTSLIQTMSQITGAITLVLGAIGAISLLVGGIGIMNIMLVTVTERTREIGIRMAIGAKRRDILLQFLAEAAAICLVGGAIGLLIGAGGAIAAAKAMSLPAGLSGDVMLMAFGVSAAIGLFFGFYPARKASKLAPVEALRTE